VRATTAVETVRKQLSCEFLADWRRIDRQLTIATRELNEAVAATATTLTATPGIATIGAAKILSIVGDVDRFPTPGHFASFTGTATIEASSGRSPATGSHDVAIASSTRCSTSPRAPRPVSAAPVGPLRPQDR
jgi:transposase